MNAHPLLLVAAAVLSLIGVMHSYLGERYVLRPVLALPDLPKLGGSRAYMESIVRWAWHLTSVAWWGTAMMLALWGSGRGPRAMGVVLAGTFAIHGLIILGKTSSRHPAWPLFFLTAAAIWFGTH